MKTLINTDVCRQLEGVIKHLETLTDANPAELELGVKDGIKYLNKYIAERKNLTRELDAYKKELMVPEKAAENIIKSAKEKLHEAKQREVAELLNQMQTLQDLDYYAALSQLERIAEPVAVITVHDISQVPLDYLTVDMAKVEAAVKSGEVLNGITVTDKWEPK